MPVTPYSGFAATLTRAPYVTDLTQTTAYVNWATTSTTPGSILVQPTVAGACPSLITKWTSAAQKVPTSLPGPVNPTSATSTTSMTDWAFSVVNGAGARTSEYQASVPLTGLQPGTRYCYAIFSTDTSSAVDMLPAAQPYQTFTTLDPVGATGTSLTFDVLGDTGENFSNTIGSSVPYPNYVNPDQAAIYKLIGSSGARFLLNAGDIAYSGGTQSNYGDLWQTGTSPEVSTIFGPYYYPQTGGIPTFAADGNHGQNVTTLRNWPTPVTATNSGGTYAFDSYSGIDGISGSYPDNWYAFSTGTVRIYMLDASWADGSSASLGTVTGSACSTPSHCLGYQADADEHWQSTSPEYKWLAHDLAAHPGGIKFAVFHYPLRSDNATQQSDPYLTNTPSNPNPNSLEKLLADNGVSLAFNGHAHIYQRTSPTGAGQITSYVTGGGGGVLEPVLGGSVCTTLQQTASVYALGWSPSSSTPGAGSGSACGTTAPQSAADVYHFLRVTVSGNTVTVTPINAAGNTFDVHTYTLDSSGTSGTPPTVPTGLTASTGATAGEIDLSWTASTAAAGTVAGYHVWRDGGSNPIATVTGTSYQDTGLVSGSTHSYAVSAFDTAGDESAQSDAVSGTAGTGPSGGSTVTVAATDDATISKLSANADVNYGQASTLTVDGDQNLNDFLMNFAVPASCTPTAATLTLTVGTGSTYGSSHGGDVYAAPGTWSESTVTANTAPALTGSPVSFGAVSLNTSYSLDVSSLLTAATTAGNVSLRVSTTSGDAAVYVSRNASNGTSAGPHLTLTC